jgi:acetyl-CoA synthetase/acetyltransferase
LRQCGAIQVFSLDALIETALVFSTLARPLKATGAAMLSLSGGEIALAVDAGEQAGLNLPPVSTARQTLTDLLPAFSHIANPLDLTWAGLYDPTVAQRCARALGEQPDTGLLILLQDAPSGLGPQQAGRYAALLGAVADGAAEAAVPLVTLSNVSSDLHPSYAEVAASKAALCLRGTQEGIAALAQRLAWDPQPSDESAPESSPETDRAEARMTLEQVAAGVQVLDEHQGRRVLASYGLPGIDEILANSAEEAAAAAQRIGFPVVLKALVAETTHKSELGLVRLMLQSVAEVRGAAVALLERAQAVAPATTPRLLVQEMVTPVAELLVGARIDPEFGPVIVAGGGGLQVELFKDVAIRLAPVTPKTAAAMIAETRSGRLLDGWRGRPRGDIAAAAAAVAALSRFLHDFADEVREVEINPLAVLEEGRGCRALDCVLVRSNPAIACR